MEEAGFAPSAAAMLAAPPFPPVPLIVLVATEHNVTPELEALWQEVQAQTAALSPRGRLQVVPGHFIQNDQPELVIEVVLEAMREAGLLQGVHSAAAPIASVRLLPSVRGSRV
jgi:hypothetical protein